MKKALIILGLFIALIEILAMTIQAQVMRAHANLQQELLHMHDVYYVVGSFDFISLLNIFLGLSVSIIAYKLKTQP